MRLAKNALVDTMLCGLLLILSHTVMADDLYMIRSSQPFPETMSALQNAINQAGYTLSKVQRVDIGLTKMGYKTDKYRVVFYGKLEQTRMLINKYPQLIPYLPLKIAIFSENGQTLLTATNPEQFSEMYPDKALTKIFSRWEKDLRNILEQVRRVGNNE